MMDILIAILISVGLTAAIVVAVLIALWVIVSTVELIEDPSNLSEENFFVFLGESLKSVTKLPLLFHRPSHLQREIMQEEKEIKQLEKQKADMERLDQLRKRKERLWQEVSSEEGKPYKLIYNGTEINRRFKTEEEAFNYAEACSDNGLFSAQVERID
ncbi:hypothetical protein [Salinicoccus roseus]|uniref:hypothetical protein n=1 Tax=Salinicoccus roseus TaxID=45670 RepID=UPI002300A028|nr:hypothetical protein [Salinicoccus roseus]